MKNGSLEPFEKCEEINLNEELGDFRGFRIEIE